MCLKVAILFSVPGEPVALGRARFSTVGGFARTYTPKESREYKQWVSTHAKRAFSWEPIANAVKLEVDIYKSIPKSFSKKKRAEAIRGERLPTGKPDTDNYLKGIKDALNGICYVDDAQVVVETVRKFYSDEPRAEIRVWEV